MRTMHGRNKQWFKTPYATQLFNRYATYNGSNPYETPATLNMIAHLEHNLGGYFPQGGMYQIAEAIYKLAIKLGVVFHFNAPVEKLLYESNKILGVLVNGKKYRADIVISNIDASAFYRKLMPNVKKPKSVQNKALSSSGIIFYWGIQKHMPQLDLHNILFSADYQAEFQAIFKEKNLPADPTVYIFISSKIEKADAPEDSENWFVMINTPANYGQNWDDLISIARQRIIQKINKQFNTQIEQYMVSEKVASPVTIEQQTGSYKGALYGNASNGILSAFKRHANFSGTFKNLYFVGGSVHPGGGIPLCLCSAKIVDELITEDYL
jgi:phytoene desaturase